MQENKAKIMKEFKASAQESVNRIKAILDKLKTANIEEQYRLVEELIVISKNMKEVSDKAKFDLAEHETKILMLANGIRRA